MKLLSILRLLRIKHWIKNLFLFFPAFFSQSLFHEDALTELVIGFFAFSFMASAIYVINDRKDIEQDREHPLKRKRALASGEVSETVSLIVLFILLASSIGISFSINSGLLLIVVTYFAINLLYTYKLKEVPILDITIISLGFLLRIFAGAVIVNISVSYWIIMMTFLLGMFLAIAKRRDDVIIFNQSGKEMRKSIKGYDLKFIDSAMILFASVTTVSYLMYTVSDDVTGRLGSSYVYLTSIFVILGILRYLHLALVEEKTGSPTQILFHDIFIQLILAGWLAAFAFFLYF